ncbi:hypothetical protein HDU98_007895 [Podochytrium sp. JEL0797]|nr:hypothetical protein HDU98_007895 [Podochytrium sp. JEL0797]
MALFSPTRHRNSLLVSPPGCFRTSLLFTVAMDEAKRDTARSVVLIVGSKSTIRANPPLLVALIESLDDSFVLASPNSTLLENITIKYAASHESLRHILAALPSSDALLGTPKGPSCILVEDLRSFFDPTKDSVETVRFTLALLVQTVECICKLSLQATDPASNCFFMVSDSSPMDFPQFKSLHCERNAESGGSKTKNAGRQQPIGFVSLLTVYEQFVDCVISVQGSLPRFTMQRSETRLLRYKRKMGVVDAQEGASESDDRITSFRVVSAQKEGSSVNAFFYVDDLVTFNGVSCLVVATPNEDESDESEHDSPLPQVGFVRVAPLNGSIHRTVKEAECVLVDRALSVGDLVKPASQSSHSSGSITSTTLNLTLLHGATATILPHSFSCTLFRFAHHLEEGMMVTHANWIGEIEELKDKIAVRFGNGSICVPRDTEQVDMCDGVDDTSRFALARFYPGQAVKSAGVNWRDGVWLRGEWFAGVGREVGVVVGVRAVVARVNWRVFNSLEATATDVQVDPPPEDIDASLLTPLTSCFEPYSFQTGDFVFFKDEGVARDALGITDPEVTMETSPYLFALRIVKTETLATILWQDSTTSHDVPSIQLVPHLNPDDHDFWPADYVQLPLSTITHETMALKDRVGLVVAMNARGRTVKVRWYSVEMDLLEGPELEYSVYELQLHPSLQHRIGDKVILTRALSDSGTDWFGEVMGVQTTDGLVRVRFLESSREGVCGPADLIVYRGSVEEEEEGSWEDESEDGMSESSDGEGGEWATDDEDGGEGKDALDWVDDEEMRESVEALGQTHLEDPPGYTSAAEGKEACGMVEGVSFKSCEVAPKGHKFYGGDGESGREFPSVFHRRIRKEYTILSHSLPPGILVRVFEDRIDLLRVLMVGPENTPYEGGLFLFDVALPEEYPAVPPKVFFHSWSFGMGRVNPNLYEGGRSFF